MHLIYGLGAFQTFVFFLLLLFKKGNQVADRFLAAFFFVVSLYLLNCFSVPYNIWKNYPDIIIGLTFVSLTYGPLLYFYVIASIGKEVSGKQILMHSLPVLITFLIIFPFTLYSRDTKLLFFTDRYINLPINITIGKFIQYLSAPIYFVGIIIILRRHKQYLKDNRSSIEKVSLSWMRKLLYGVITIWLIDCINGVIMNFTYLEYTYAISYFIKLTFALFIIPIGYYGITQGSVFINNTIDKKSDCVSKKDVSKGVSDQILEKYSKILSDYMQDEKAFLNSEIRIQDIAVKLNLPVHTLSHVINTVFDQNFYNFINSYRIKEAKQRLLDPKYDNLTIVAISYDCGFNSKATFNRLFKQFTGVTPTQYKSINGN